VFVGALTGNASGSSGSCSGTAAIATQITVTDNESTNENNLVLFAADAADTSGTVSAEFDGNLTYNPSTGTLNSTVFVGALTGNASGSSGSCSGTAAVATQITVTDNESTDENNLILFAADAADSSGAISAEFDGNLTYNPSTGVLAVPVLSAGAGVGGTNNWIQQWGVRMSTYFLNWHKPPPTYGPNYYQWGTNMGTTSLPTTWPDSEHPCIVIPVAMTLKSYHLHGNASSSQTYELVLMKGYGITYGSAGDWDLTQCGSTQSNAVTSGVINKWEETGLSVSLAAGDSLLPLWRRTTTSSSNTYYIEGSFSIVCEID